MKKDQFKSIFLKVDFFKGVNMYKVLLFSVFISSCFSFITALLPLFVLPIFEMNHNDFVWPHLRYQIIGKLIDKVKNFAFSPLFFFWVSWDYFSKINYFNRVYYVLMGGMMASLYNTTLSWSAPKHSKVLQSYYILHNLGFSQLSF